MRTAISTPNAPPQHQTAWLPPGPEGPGFRHVSPMKLARQLNPDDQILLIANSVNEKFPDATGQCEIISSEVVRRLTADGIRAEHAVGEFQLDQPDAFNYMDGDDEDGQDLYQVNHDWVEIGTKILDISARQFRKSVSVDLPDVVYIDYNHPLYTRYQRLN